MQGERLRGDAAQAAFAWTRCCCQRSISWHEWQGAGWENPFSGLETLLLSIARASSCSCAEGNYREKKIFVF